MPGNGHFGRDSTRIAPASFRANALRRAEPGVRCGEASGTGRLPFGFIVKL